MPVQINEIIIHAEVNDASTAMDKGRANPEVQKDRLVKECVEAVMRILKEKEER